MGAWSNIHISFADYLAPGAEDVDSLIVFTAFDEDGAIVDTVLEDTIDTDGLEAFALFPGNMQEALNLVGLYGPSITPKPLIMANIIRFQFI